MLEMLPLLLLSVLNLKATCAYHHKVALTNIKQVRKSIFKNSLPIKEGLNSRNERNSFTQ